jgi:hypothetical protein
MLAYALWPLLFFLTDIFCVRRSSLHKDADGVLCDIGAEGIETIDRDQLIDCKRTLSIVFKSVAKIQ